MGKLIDLLRVMWFWRMSEKYMDLAMVNIGRKEVDKAFEYEKKSGEYEHKAKLYMTKRGW